MSWLGWSLAVLAVLLLVALAAPVWLSFEIRRHGTLRVRARLRALYGLIQAEIGTRDKTAARKVPTSRPARVRGRVSAALFSRGFVAALWRYLRRLVAAIKVVDLRARIRVGLADPADTGVLWGAVATPAVLVGALYPQLRIEPSFESACLDIDARGQLLAVPLHVMAITAVFFLSPATLRALMAMRRRR